MEDKKQKKEELIGRLLGRYASEKGFSIIKIGEDSLKEDTITRLNKANARYRTQIGEFLAEKRRLESKLNFHVRTQKESFNKINEDKDCVIKENDELKQKVGNLNDQVGNLNDQVGNLNAEIELRRKEDNRFNMLDI